MNTCQIFQRDISCAVKFVIRFTSSCQPTLRMFWPLVERGAEREEAASSEYLFILVALFFLRSSSTANSFACQLKFFIIDVDLMFNRCVATSESPF
jgi:hypothetical protein